MGEILVYHQFLTHGNISTLTVDDGVEVRNIATIFVELVILRLFFISFQILLFCRGLQRGHLEVLFEHLHHVV